MTDPADQPELPKLPNMRKRFERVRAQAGSGGGPTGGGGGLEHRVSTLEKGAEKTDGKLDNIAESLREFRISVEQRFGAAAERLTSIEAKLETKASAIDAAEIKGRVTFLPTAWQMIVLIVGTVFTILGGAFLILKFGLPRT